MNKDYNDEGLINNLVDKYIETGLDQWKKELLMAFDPYFKKYAYILCSNNPVDLSNKDTITFLRLFMTKEERTTSQGVFSASRKILSYLRMAFNDLTPEDMYDEMICIFLEQLARYRPMIADHTQHKSRISFTHFLQVNTRYKVKQLATLRGKDALHGYDNVEFNDEMIGIEPSKDQYGPSKLDNRWIKGSTAGDLFNQLEEYERYLLYLKYENDQAKPLSDYDLANITGSCRMYIRRRMLKIRDKLKKLVEV